MLPLVLAHGGVVQHDARHSHGTELLELGVALAVRLERMDRTEVAVGGGDHLANGRTDVGAAVGDDLVVAQAGTCLRCGRC